MKFLFVLINCTILISALFVKAATADSCESYSPSISDKYWWVLLHLVTYLLFWLMPPINTFFSPDRVAVGSCTECSAVEGCGFCLSSLQCIPGVESGPLDGVPCPSWIYSSPSCPGTSHLAILLVSCFICQEFLELTQPYCSSYYYSRAELPRLCRLFRMCLAGRMCVVCVRQHMQHYLRRLWKRLSRSCIRTSLPNWLRTGECCGGQPRCSSGRDLWRWRSQYIR